MHNGAVRKVFTNAVIHNIHRVKQPVYYSTDLHFYTDYSDLLAPSTVYVQCHAIMQ